MRATEYFDLSEPEDDSEFVSPFWDLMGLLVCLTLGVGIPGLGLYALMMWAATTFV